MVHVPVTVWVSPSPKVRVSAAATDFVRLWKVVSPSILCAVPSKVTVPVRGV